MTASVDLLEQEQICLAGGTPVEDVISELGAVSSTLSRSDPAGFAWVFPVRETTGPFDEVDTLCVGIRGEVGTLLWYDESGAFAPTGGEYTHWAEYTTWHGHDHSIFPNADGIDLPISTVFAALREFAHSGRRPTCVEWADVEEMSTHPIPPIDYGEIMVLPEMSTEDVESRLTPADRPRSWKLFFADDDTDVRLRTDAPPMLWVGLDVNARGFVLWQDTTGMYLPADGTEDRSQTYFLNGDAEIPVVDGSMLPIERVQQAIREAVTTRQRPTCCEWVPR